MSELLPIHGFVLAGGRSTRMGVDKATLLFRGRAMVEIAVEKLRSFCAEVSICGNRDDLAGYAEVVRETRLDAGPAAGIEAGLRAARRPWALFIPVDVPLVPAHFLRLWIEEAIRVNMTVSFLVAWEKQPAFCLLRRERGMSFTSLLDSGSRALEPLLNATAEMDDVASWAYDPYDLYGFPQYGGPSENVFQSWFANINSPDDLALAEALQPSPQ